MGTIPYGRQDITPEDIAAVVDVLQSDWLTQGPKVPEFEAALASCCGARYAVVVSSATAALHLACIAAGLQGGDRLWTSPITFVASANCGRYCGATVDFVDIDPHTYNLSVSALADKLAIAKKQGTLPKVVIPVHLAGQSCEMAALAELAQTYSFTLIEDASHALGGHYRGRPIGCCEFSTMAVFSFHPVKIITTGEGGAILTNDPGLYQQLIRLRSHGITRDPQHMVSDSHGPWYYQQLELGFNYRMTDLQAALGLQQLQRLDQFVERRRFLAQRYHQSLADLPLTLPFQHPDTRSSWHLYIIRLKRDQIQASHREVFEALRSLGIGVNLHYIPVHTQPYYQQLGFQWGDFPNAEAYYQEAISLPLYYGLTLAQQDQVIQALKQVLA
ncbi:MULTISPECIES: UDP-4-amino-4,6-dideoxy-N-acetyl-beta-L-altrosamine transaminase [unclassified Thermosynechococcus]|uniref:UDP-4-amino-4, 6-dideoxy-N-acetyl-beta-L-altrosamine transaminase n=1 Tax=unclassified Thermosynechococcus TaxID=2622553 RepID=UPI002873A37A|nr:MULTISPECIES: UDP-4-amino-4,6-dideoxy-N-acetyl-beta-L-altrosamine transaminase [unclassified Thermosynechococcus]WNC32659.1 UDP-4-amino-4,6-dideoxy-N-acetyl-beta-L-altrosamine transaminase [Thermosynechococcus sp. PKX95]WNC35188.1 UDP-4-amino-4,6-dideoxy-N-acetyl-beta-L-altrosamine transaminase [Thermosynechococcus sp. PKX91]WNC37706.1 UDP-4-amino-4,6-dideoxy-N-acetyl-beta-L-altrosamine transaminase [Thermosynechococcus sp. WL11]WNC40227.1 UDP-4-amino-4,6-dideoxy-N-acetyl-beta-L-altrosamine 